MRLPENDSDWLSAYLRDIEIANNELKEKNFYVDPKSVVCEIYVLPSHNHQTFYGKLLSDRGFYKIIYAKAIQNSIWFSEPIYMYRFEEAKLFENHPMKKGRIVCRAKLMEKTVINRLLLAAEKLDASQPADAVQPSIECTFTAIEFYENGIASRKVMYTDPEKLAFRSSVDNAETLDFLRNLYLVIEKIIGIGD